MEHSSIVKTRIKDEQSLITFIDQAIVNSSSDTLSVICAGHFMLLPDKTKLKVIPGIFNDTDTQDYNNAKSTIGIFPQYTWRIGCIILDRLKRRGKRGHLSLLINDWQLVPTDRQREESEPNKFRDLFYKEFKMLPDIYREEMKLRGLSFPEDVYQTEDKEFYLREVRLRDRFIRKVKSLITKGGKNTSIGMCSLNLDECGDIRMNTEDDLSYALTVSSRAGCAGGICQMIVDIAHSRCNKFSKINFVNLMPSGCTIPVNIASELAVNILGEETPHITVGITNIYFEGYGTTTAADFYVSPGVSSYQF